MKNLINSKTDTSSSAVSLRAIDGKYYRQAIILRGEFRRRALAWLNTSNMKTRGVRNRCGLGPGEILLIGAGLCFEPFFSDEVLRMCFGECTPTEKEKDFKPLVEYLRSIGG